MKTPIPNEVNDLFGTLNKYKRRKEEEPQEEKTVYEILQETLEKIHVIKNR